jgi:hypothetical protein
LLVFGPKCLECVVTFARPHILTNPAIIPEFHQELDRRVAQRPTAGLRLSLMFMVKSRKCGFNGLVRRVSHGLDHRAFRRFVRLGNRALGGFEHQTGHRLDDHAFGTISSCRFDSLDHRVYGAVTHGRRRGDPNGKIRLSLRDGSESKFG